MNLSEQYATIPVEKNEIPQALLDIDRKYRSNPIKWNGQFSPQLVEILLKTYADSQDTVFDPFSGSGTVLLEAGRLQLAAIGTEVNPAAYLLSDMYRYMNYSRDERRKFLNNLAIFLDTKFEADLLNPDSVKYDEMTIKTALLDTLRQSKNDHLARLLSALIVLLDFKNSNLNLDAVFQVQKSLADLVISLPYSAKKIELYHADARQTTLADNSLDLVITSPPYINVFNYHQQYRKSLEFLEYDILKIAKSEIGANRKHRSNRFLTVIQYCMDIALVMNELGRICRDSARLIFVVGRESSVRGTAFYNSELVTEIARSVFGLELYLRQERYFRNRFGQNIYEDILHFTLTDSPAISQHAILEKARSVAQKALEASYNLAPENARNDIENALLKIEQVAPSPLLDSTDNKFEHK